MDLLVTVDPPEKAFECAEEAAGRAETGEQTPAVVSFADVDGLRQVLKDEYLDILRELLSMPADSVDELVTRMNRDRQEVKEAIDELVGYGIVEQSAGQLTVPYDSIQFRMTVR